MSKQVSEEENIAIKTLKEVASDNFDTLGDDISPKMAQNILKEIEKLKDKCKELIIEKQQLTSALLDSTPNDKIREKIKNIEDIYKKEMKPYQTEYGLNVSLLSKKEKEELINKRNGLLMQKITLEELLEEK